MEIAQRLAAGSRLGLQHTKMALNAWYRQAMPIFEAWLKPFNDVGATTVASRNTGSTDHISYDRVGLPGFQFIQDRLDYFSNVHHSNLDTWDHAEPEDLKQAAAIVASFVYNAAMREERMPRKPLLEE